METSALPGPVITILLGLIVLTSGRRLFWLFVGVIGFAVGFQYAPSLFKVESEMLLVILSLGLGVGGAFLAIFFQKIAIGLAGFAAGGYIAMHLLELFGLGTGSLPWLPSVIGGIVGAALLFLVFDWALIFISSLAGAGMIVHALSPAPLVETLIFIGLAIFGIVLQTRIFRRSSTAPKQNRQEK